MGPGTARALGILLIATLPRAAGAQDRPRLPLSISLGLDAPAGTGALSLAIESSGGWGAGAAIGLSDAKPGDVHQHLAVHGRFPLLRLGRVETAALALFSRADREREIHLMPLLGRYIRWEWRPAYRVDVALSARLRSGAWAARLDAGIGYVLNEPRCQYNAPNVYVERAPCDDPRIPADLHATDAKGRLAPWVALAGEYDLIAPAAPPPPDDQPARWDARETNAWLAPTALTLPAGSVRLTAYELILPDVAVGITDRIQVSGGITYLPPSDAVDILWRAEAKVRVLDLGRLHVALTAQGLGYSGEYNTHRRLLGAGGVASVCLDVDCASLISTAAFGGIEDEDPDEGLSSSTSAALINPSFAIAVFPRVKLVAEAHLLLGTDGFALALALVRIPLRHLVIEVGSALGSGEFFPIGSLSWRF
jgi:hypothetical protein